MHIAHPSETPSHTSSPVPSRGQSNTIAASLLTPFSDTLTGKAVIALSASLFVAACAHLSVRIPYTPVPFTLGDFAVLLVGLALGPSMAWTALLLYLVEGASGLPVFAPGGPGGTAQLLGPTGGFLLCYPFAAALAGSLRQTLTRILPGFGAGLVAAAAASALLMTAGVTWLGNLLHLAPAVAFHLGALPFLPGQLVKIAAAAGIYASLQRWRRA